MGGVEDKRAVEAVRAGQRDEFGSLVERYFPAVVSVASARCGDQSEAEDIAQETFLKAYQSLDQLKDSGKFAPWIMTICRRLASRLSRSRGREQQRVSRSDPDSAAVTPDIESRERRMLIEELVVDLDEPTREIVHLFYFGGYAGAEIAEMLQMSEAAVRKRLERGRQTLGEKLLKSTVLTAAEREKLERKARHVSAAVLATNPAWETAGAGASAWFGILSAKSVAMLGLTAGLIAVVGSAVYLSNQRLERSPMQIAVAGAGTDPETTADSPVPPEGAVGEGMRTQESHDGVRAGPIGGADTPPGIDAQQGSTPSVTGIVIDHEGNPVSDATAVAVRIVAHRVVERLETVTDEKGRFAFSEVDPADEVGLAANKEGLVRMFGPGMIPTPRGVQLKVKPFNPPHAGAELTMGPAATIRGRVVDGNGHVVPRKAVTVRHQHPDGILSTEESETDSAGRFEVTGLLPGTYSISVVPEDQSRKALVDTEVDLALGETKSSVVVQYPGDGYVVAGRVVDENGRPIKGALFQLLAVHGGDPADDRTDANGAFRLLRIPDGEFMAMIFHRDYENGHATVRAGDEDVLVTLRSNAKTSLRGRVVSATTNEPITSYELQVIESDVTSLDTHQFGFFEQVESEDGTFVREDVPRRKVTVVARSPGMEYALEKVDLSIGAGHVTVRMKPSHEAVGYVLDVSGTPISDAYVLLSEFPHTILSGSRPESLQLDWLTRNAVARSGPDGSFLIDSLPPSFDVMTAVSLGRGFGSVPVSYHSLRDEAVEITVRKGVEVSGCVTVGGEARENARIQVHTADADRAHLGSATTDDTGAYRIANVPPGEFTLTTRLQPAVRSALIFAEGRQRRDSLSAEAGDQLTHNVDFPPGSASIAGIARVGVETAVGGRAHLYVETADGIESNLTSIESDGSFRFDEVPVGEARVVVQAGLGHGELSPGEERFSVAEGILQEISIDVQPGQSITGTIVGLRPDENHVRVTALEVYRDARAHTNSWVRGRASTSVDAHGDFQVNGLEPGTYELVVSATVLDDRNGLVSSRSDRFEVTVLQDVDVQLEPIRLPN